MCNEREDELSLARASPRNPIKRGSIPEPPSCVGHNIPSNPWLQETGTLETPLGPAIKGWDRSPHNASQAYKPYHEGTENTSYYNTPLYSKEQVQGAIDLSSVRYNYYPEVPCGPGISSCHQDQIPRLSYDPRGSQTPVSTHWDPAVQLSFLRPKGNVTGKQGASTKKDFSGIIFCGDPQDNPKILLINQDEAFNWLRHMLYSVNAQGQETFSPDRLLSTEGLLEKGELCSISDCHYLAIHQPTLTKKQGRLSSHDQRVWIEPSKAKVQVFSCSGNIRQHD